jgi:hypothetical protein
MLIDKVTLPKEYSVTKEHTAVSTDAMAGKHLGPPT